MSTKDVKDSRDTRKITYLEIVVGEVQGGDVAKGHGEVRDSVHGQAAHVQLLLLDLLLVMLSVLQPSSCSCPERHDVGMPVPMP